MDIKSQELRNEIFSKYGEAIFVKEGQNPDSSGEGWECWYPLSVMNTGNDFYLGIVRSKPEFLGTKFLERHLDREEYVIALEHPILEIVGLSDPKKPDYPDIHQTEAFIINPGQMVKINPGIWHSAGIAFKEKESLYLFLLGKPTRRVDQVDSGLVGFSFGDVATIL